MQHEAQADAAASCNPLGGFLPDTVALQQAVLAGEGSSAAAGMPPQQLPTTVPQAAASTQHQQPFDTSAALAAALGIGNAQVVREYNAAVHRDMKEAERRARNRITWGSRSSRAKPQSGPKAAARKLQEQVPYPASSNDSDSVVARNDHQGQQQTSRPGDLLQLIGAAVAAAGVQGPTAAGLPQQSRQATPAASSQEPSAAPATADVEVDSRAVTPAAAAQEGGQQHSDLLTKLGRVLLELRRQGQQPLGDSNSVTAKQGMSQPAALSAPAADVGGSKRPLPGSTLDTQPAKAAKVNQLSGPGKTAAAASSPRQRPSTSAVARGGPLPVVAVKSDVALSSNSVPAAVVQRLSPSPGPPTAAVSSSIQQQRAVVLAAHTATTVAAKATSTALPVLQLPLAMRVSYLRAAGFLPPDASKTKRKADRQPEDGTVKPAAPRKRGRRKFSGDEPVVGWDERTYTQGSDRQRVWEEHKMVLRVIDLVLQPESEVAARVRQATVVYNARSCVSCWRARPVSGSWFCSRPICWDKHKQLYEGEAITAAAVTAADELHWSEVKKVVQPVLKEREKQKQLQQEGSSTAAAADDEADAVVGGAAGIDDKADADVHKATTGADSAAAGSGDAASPDTTSSSNGGNADAAAGQPADGATSPAAAAATSAKVAASPVANADGSASASASLVVSPAIQEQAEVQQIARKDPFIVLSQAQQLIDNLEAGKRKHITLADVEKLQVMKEQIKLDVSSYNPHMMRLTHFIRKARRNFQGAKSSRVQQNAGQPQEGQAASHAAAASSQLQQQQQPVAADTSSSKGQQVQPQPAAAGGVAGQDSNLPEPAAADVSASQPPVGIREAQLVPVATPPTTAAGSGSAEPASNNPDVSLTAAAESVPPMTAAANDGKAVAIGAGEMVVPFSLPTREYKYPDLKRLWEEHQLNLRALLIELKDQLDALGKVQDVITKVFHRPCLRCMSDGGHKCGNGCWFCSNCQRMWGKLNPISDEQAWKTITTGVGIDPRFVARRRGMGVGQLADAAPPVTVMAVTDSKQPSAHVAITPAPAAGATTELPV